jgi:hypothetical protein
MPLGFEIRGLVISEAGNDALIVAGKCRDRSIQLLSGREQN